MATPWKVPRDLCAGRTVAVFASGPSLTREDCDKCEAAGFYRIAVNDAFKLAPTSDMLYAADAKWWNFHRDEALKFGGLKVTVDESVVYHHVMQLGWRKKEPSGPTLGYSDDPAVICTGGNSGYQAVHIAALGGAKRIILLGFDMRSKGGKSHFFGDHPAPLTNEPQVWPQFVAAFRTLAPELKKRGVEVLNCTEGSALDAFPMATLCDALMAAWIAGKSGSMQAAHALITKNSNALASNA